MRPSLTHRLFLLLLFCILLIALPAQAHDVVWSGLIYASNETVPAPPPVELAAFSHKLQHIFGYNQLQLLSQHREIMDAQSEHWLLPGKGFCLLVDTKNAGVNHLLTLHLYQEKRLVVQTVVLLARQSPIFLKGPLYGDGQLIIVLLVE